MWPFPAFYFEIAKQPLLTILVFDASTRCKDAVSDIWLNEPNGNDRDTDELVEKSLVINLLSPT